MPNGLVDKHAKAAAAVRCPLPTDTRLIRSEADRVVSVAMWIGKAIEAANHWPAPESRDPLAKARFVRDSEATAVKRKPAAIVPLLLPPVDLPRCLSWQSSSRPLPLLVALWLAPAGRQGLTGLQLPGLELPSGAEQPAAPKPTDRLSGCRTGLKPARLWRRRLLPPSSG